MKQKIHSIFPNFWNRKWVSYAHSSISDALSFSGFDVVNYVYAADVNSRYSGESCFPGKGYRLFSLVPDKLKRDCLHRKLIKNAASGDVIYSWLDFEKDYLKSRMLRDMRWVKEFINCPLYLRERQLAKAYASLGLSYNSGLQKNDFELEIECAKSVSLNFCSNPQVYRALVDASVPPEKCALVSYGWEADRIDGSSCLVEKKYGIVNFIFVGTFDIRKGAVDIMRAWRSVKVKGKLIIAGEIDPIIKIHFADVLARESVIVLGHVDDVGSVYRSGDVFLFPTWEEGGPLVTFEALSQGLYCVTSLMGSTGIIENFPEVGQIIEPGCHDQLADVISTISSSYDFLACMKSSARRLALTYDWRNAGFLRSLAINNLC